jgi:hypothetical protein
MKVYALIKDAFDDYTGNWHYDIDTIELFTDKDKRDAKMKELEPQTGKYERDSYEAFEVELQ